MRTRSAIQLLILAAMLMGLPLLGVFSVGLPVGRYLEFPPRTNFISHAAFSWPAFTAYSLVILAVVIPLVAVAVTKRRQSLNVSSSRTLFPWWGWAGVGTGLCTWVLAWTRFSWFSAFQPHTFTPLWLSFILVVNGLTYRRSGTCLMKDRPGFFLFLFPASAVFWWFFEYLNRFVQSWHYLGEKSYGPLEYFILATISFSTVLPAVSSVQEWIREGGFMQHFKDFAPLRPIRPKAAAWAMLSVAGCGLALVGVLPDLLFPLLWVSPLLILVSLQQLFDEEHMLSDLARGDWREVLSWSLAALFCGWFWEMWNYYSLARWVYTIPYVERLRVFEMPILGYAGYLPFGLECAVAAGLVRKLTTCAVGSEIRHGWTRINTDVQKSEGK